MIRTTTNQKATGNVATFTYNNRHQIMGVSYNDAGATPTVTFGDYDEYGGRTSMTASGVSTTTYGYNSFHQLENETVAFNGLAGNYQLKYWYNYVGAPTSVRYTAQAWVRWVNYDYNSAGALKGVGTDLLPDAAYSNTDDVLKNISYRGFGGVKSATYGFNPRKLSVGYDAKRQQMTSLNVRRTNDNDAIIDKSYDYANGGANNGRLQKITNNLDAAYTTTYTYDAYNRLTNASATAYGRSLSYDNWGNLTDVTMTGMTESGAMSYSLSYTADAVSVARLLARATSAMC